MPELIALIQQNSTIFIIIASLLGLVIGSFLNVVIHRLPIMMDMDWREQCASLNGIDNAKKTKKYNLITPRSTCPHCKKAIAARRTALLDAYYLATQNGDTEGMNELRDAMNEFSRKNPEPGVRIESSTISRSNRSHKQREREMVDGIHINKNLRRRLDDIYGTADEED